MVTWQAEGNAGKKTIIVNFKSEEGKRIAFDLVKKADVVLLNKSDAQVKAMGLDREALDQINTKAVHLNVQARRGENIHSESAMWPGYDPALQVRIEKISGITIFTLFFCSRVKLAFLSDLDQPIAQHCTASHHAWITVRLVQKRFYALIPQFTF